MNIDYSLGMKCGIVFVVSQTDFKPFYVMFFPREADLQYIPSELHVRWLENTSILPSLASNLEQNFKIFFFPTKHLMSKCHHIFKTSMLSQQKAWLSERWSTVLIDCRSK